ncbi:hypothetical protein [Parabacteroides chinchillae]|uniref:Chromosome segregation ATPase n=1 Tax=Parabacteroides chinchillae TaxID=871327 RepID=A0A8G2F2S5_9BACT|nr:hypothetical protein [Parabacteroides chinchillae]SEF86119.1 hypothetical protein SAMN05444001_108107 [Parabacteroides chinchillae]
MNTEPIYVTFEFNGNLGEEVSKVKLGIQGLRNESANTYKRLLADSNEAFNAMSANNRKLAVSIQEDINSLRQLAAAQKAADDALAKGTISAKDYAETKARLSVQEADLRQGIQDNMAALDESIQKDREAVGSIEAKQEALARLEETYRKLSSANRNGQEGQQLLAQISTLKSELSGLDKAYQDATGSGQSLLQTIQSTPGPVGQTASAIGKMTKAALAFIATPLGMFLAAIAAGLAAVTSWFHRTEEGENALAVATATFGQVLDSLLDVVDNVGEWLYKAFTNPKKALSDLSEFIKGQFMNRLSSISKMGSAIVKIFSEDWKQGFADFGNAFLQFQTGIEDAGKKASEWMDDTIEKSKRQGEIQRELNKIKDETRVLNEQIAQDEIKKLKLQEKARDEQVPEKERLAALKEINKIIDDTSRKEADLAKRKMDLTKELHTLSHSDRAANDEDSRLKVEYLNKQANGIREQLSLIRLKNGITNRINKEEAKTAIDLLKKELDKKKEAYALYYQQVENLGKAAADKAYASLIKDGASYREYLQKQIVELEKKNNRSKDDNDALSFLYYEKSQLEGKKSAADLMKEEIEKLKTLYGNDLSKLKEELLKLQEMNAGDKSETGVQKGNVINQALNEADKEADAKFKDLLKTYQTGFQKLATLEENYRKDVAFLRSRINENSTEEEKQQIEDAVKARTEAYGNALLKESDMFTRLFSDLSRESTKELEKLLDQAKSTDLTGFSPKDIKVFQDAVIKLENELRERNPFKSLSNDFKELISDIKGGKDLTQALDKLGKSFSAAKDYINSLSKPLGQVFGDDVTYAIDQAMELAQAVFDVGTGIAKLTQGDIIGGVSGIIKGIGSVFSMGKKVKEMNRKAREEQQKYYDEAIEGERKYQLMLRERLRTQQEIGESALAYNKRITTELAKQQQASANEYQRLLAQIQGEDYISGVGYKHGTWFRKAKTWNEYSSLAGKSYEDIEKLYTEGKLEDKVAKLFEQLKELKEEGADINQMLADQAEAMREAWTGTTVDSIADSIIQGFAEGKRSAADFADSFQEMLNTAVLQGIKMKVLEEPLRQWYESFAAASSGGLTADKIADLRAQYDKIIADAAKQLEDTEKITGIPVGAEASRTAAAKGIASMSQDSADQLNGNFNALLIYQDKTSKAITNINTLLVQGLSTLNRIANNTDRLENIEKDITSMRSNFQQIINNGILLRKS